MITYRQRRGEPRAYAMMIQMINATVGRRVRGGRRCG